MGDMNTAQNPIPSLDLDPIEAFAIRAGRDRASWTEAEQRDFLEVLDLVARRHHVDYGTMVGEYLRGDPLTPHENYPDALYISDGPWQDRGGGIVRWERTWASVPITRTEPESFLYQYQYFSVSTSTSSTQPTTDPTTGQQTSGGSGNSSESLSLGALTRGVASRVTYEYFVVANIGDFPILNRPQYEIMGTILRKIGDGNLTTSTLIFGAFVSTDGPNFIAESSVYQIYQGLIQCRKTRYMDAPTDAFWGSELGLGSFTISPATATLSQDQTLTLTGTGTNWVAPAEGVTGTTFGASAGTIGTVTINASAQTATINYTAPTSAQAVRFLGSDGSVGSNTVAVTGS